MSLFMIIILSGNKLSRCKQRDIQLINYTGIVQFPVYK